jgi:hypothetical protein
MERNCNTCAFLMLSESAEKGVRCGFKYYSLPTTQRRGLNFRNLKEVDLRNRCYDWQEHSPSILRERVS